MTDALASDAPIEIPYSDLSAEALRGVVESFVLREGTDYGAREWSLDEKVQLVMQQLRGGGAAIVFEPTAQTVTILKSG